MMLLTSSTLNLIPNHLCYPSGTKFWNIDANSLQDSEQKLPVTSRTRIIENEINYNNEKPVQQS